MYDTAREALVRFLFRAWRIARWPLGLIALAYLSLVVYELFAIPKHSAEVVAAIRAQKLTMADVDGSHLPPPPDPTQVDATVAGVDANGNGIRDDVELAIFKKYPGNSNIKIRAAELQYAMAEQLYLTNVFDTPTWKTVAEQDDRAYQCIGRTYPRDDLSLHLRVTQQRARQVEDSVFNTTDRVRAHDNVDQYATSFGLPVGDVCDVE